MITGKIFQKLLEHHDFIFFSGVPDSTLGSWISELADGKENIKHIAAVNECEALSICAGYHIATGMVGVTYLQNSGLGYCTDPLASLCDREVYSIPVLLVIGWRGMPGEKDEPQHIRMGRITPGVLDALDVPYSIVDGGVLEVNKQIENAKRVLLRESRPFALIIKPNFFEKAAAGESTHSAKMQREDAINAIVDKLDDTCVVISTTGKTSRELYECRDAKGQGHNRDFYTIGSMGCSAPIALGLALSARNKIIVFDGDGSVLMQMGILATIGKYGPNNLYHVIFDNESYESCGGQPTVSGSTNFEIIARACGYKTAKTVSSMDELSKISFECQAPALFVVKIAKGSRKNLGRPTIPPAKNKESLKRFLNESNRTEIRQKMLQRA